MGKRKTFKQGSLVQDVNGKIFIYVKRSKEYSHVIELDETGTPVGLTTAITKNLKDVYNLPTNFKTIEIL